MQIIVKSSSAGFLNLDPAPRQDRGLGALANIGLASLKKY